MSGERAGRVVQVRCKACGATSPVRVRPGTTIFRCPRCGGFTLVLADANGDVRDVRAVELEEPLILPGRLRIARPELWPSRLAGVRGAVEAVVEGRAREIAPEVERAIRLLLRLGVLEVEGGE